MKKKKDKLQTTAKMGDSSCIAYHFPSEFDVRVRKKGATKLISDELQQRKIFGSFDARHSCPIEMCLYIELN